MKKIFLIIVFLLCFLLLNCKNTVFALTPGECALRDWEVICVPPIEIFCNNRDDLTSQGKRLCCVGTLEDPKAEKLCADYIAPTPNPDPGQCPYCYDPQGKKCTDYGSGSCPDDLTCCSLPPEANPQPGSVCEEYSGYMCINEGACQFPDQKPDLICPSKLECCYVGTGFSIFNPLCNRGTGIRTALGCMPIDPKELIKRIFPYLLGIGGTIAFGFIIFGGIQVMTSSGDPEKIKGGKELITSALTGLVFIILSLFLLKLIGVDILGLPGLE